MKPQAVDFSFVNKNIKDGGVKSDNLLESDFSLFSELASSDRGSENPVKIFVDGIDVANSEVEIPIVEPDSEEFEELPTDQEDTEVNSEYAAQFTVLEPMQEQTVVLPPADKTDSAVTEAPPADSEDKADLSEKNRLLRKNFDYKDNAIPVDKNYEEFKSESINFKAQSLTDNHTELNNMIRELDLKLDETKNFTVPEAASIYTDEVLDDSVDYDSSAEYDNGTVDEPIKITDSSDFENDFSFDADGELLEAFRAIYNTQSLSKDSTVYSFSVENDFSLNIERLVDIIERSVAGNVKEVNLQLQPESLGNVTLKFTRDSAGVSVKIGVRDEEVREMLLGDLQSLSKTLNGKGLSAAVVEIVTESRLGGSYKDGRGHKNGRGGGNNGGRKKTSDFNLPDSFFKDMLSE